MPAIHLRLLGGFDVYLEGMSRHALRVSTRKGRALLAYLAMRADQLESRARLADLFWGDCSDAQARHSLRQCLVVLRRDLQAAGTETLIIDGERIALNGVSVDARDFADAVAGGDLDRAVSLYRGEFLAELAVDNEGFDEWVRLERDRLAGLAARAFSGVAQAADNAGEGARAIAIAERLAGFNPFSDEAERLLLRIYARHRGRDAALAHAKAFALRLRDELDVHPDSQTAELVAHIKEGLVPLAESTIRSPPAPPSRQVQRSDQSTLPLPPIPRAVPFAAAAAALMVMFGILGLLWTWPETARQPAPSAVDASLGVAGANESWRSPAIYSGAVADEAALASAHRQALVVLPFSVDDATDRSALTFANRVTTDLINDLSRAPTIRVISARTSQLYGNRPIDVAAIGAELGVHYVVEGSIRRQESRIGINVALVDAKTRLQVWSERFDRDLTERFSVQDEIVKGIARILHVAVIVKEGGQRTDDGGDIGDLLAKGWAAIFRANETGGPGDAKTYFENALQKQPDNPSALTGLAAHHIVSLVFEVPDDRTALIDRAEELLLRALREKPQSGPAHYYLGLAKKARGDLDGALGSFTKTIEINPSHAPAYANAGHVLIRMGRLDEGLDHVRYAIRLSPKDPALASWQIFAGEAEIARGNDDAAVEWLTRAITLSPRRIHARALLAATYALMGDAEATAQQVGEWKKLTGGVEGASMLNTIGGVKKLSPRIGQGLRLALDPSS